ncbi:MAG: response regulator [Candidatus Heimdallarchaeota archaeon]|nr:response regulator [Candidatus Heimdallarchaeota archaeon]
MSTYEKFFNGFNQGIIIFNGKGEIVEINPEVKNILNQNKSEIIGKNIADLLEIELLDKTVLEAFSRGNSIENVEFSINKEHGLINLILYAYELEKGLGYIILRDLAYVKDVQEKIQLEQSMNLLGIMARGIAHDFNNLLMGISGSLNLLILDSKSLTQSQRKFVLDAQKALFQATGLVKQFQYLARDEQSRNIKVDLYSAVKNVFSFLDRTSSKVIEKKINFNPGTIFVFADPVKMNQVILNLANNSINAMGNRSAEAHNYISVSANYAEEGVVLKKGMMGRKYIHVKIEDNGVGIPKDRLDKIFIPFYSSQDKAQKGHMRGLGLPITYDIITRQFEGLIEIESAEGESTTVHLFLPGEGFKELEKIEHVQEELPKGSETILIADDEHTVRNVLTISLQKLGYKVHAAQDGEECIEKYNEFADDISVLVLDITMPKMSGVEVMTKVRKMNPKAKIIISSGHTEDEIHQGILSKADGHLNKPYDTQVLASTLRRVIEKD